MRVGRWVSDVLNMNAPSIPAALLACGAFSWLAVQDATATVELKAAAIQ